MTGLVLYCKSYRADLRRVLRLAESVQALNKDGLPFYLSVPQTDLALFTDALASLPVELIADEDILRCSPSIDARAMENLSGSLAQQIVKSEFWRLGLSDAYLCLDSDAVFIRPFFASDYMSEAGVPYLVMSEAQSLMEQSLALHKSSVIDNFHRESAQVQDVFGRAGKAYSFGPMPIVWHRAVWESLDRQFLKPRGMNFLDAILQAPLESRWYGEALLKFKAIDFLPAEPFFKVYHYAWQWDADRRNRVTFNELAKIYSGVIFQSSWERDMDWPSEGGSLGSRLGRRVRRILGRI